MCLLLKSCVVNKFSLLIRSINSLSHVYPLKQQNLISWSIFQPLKSFNAFIIIFSWIFHSSRNVLCLLKFLSSHKIDKIRWNISTARTRDLWCSTFISFEWRKLCGKVMFTHLQVIICSVCVCITYCCETNKLKDFEPKRKKAFKEITIQRPHHEFMTRRLQQKNVLFNFYHESWSECRPVEYSANNIKNWAVMAIVNCETAHSI